MLDDIVILMSETPNEFLTLDEMVTSLGLPFNKIYFILGTNPEMFKSSGKAVPSFSLNFLNYNVAQILVNKTLDKATVDWRADELKPLFDKEGLILEDNNLKRAIKNYPPSDPKFDIAQYYIDNESIPEDKIISTNLILEECEKIQI